MQTRDRREAGREVNGRGLWLETDALRELTER
jgi:hypothetical protein